MKRFIILLIAICPFILTCSKDVKNQEMLEMVNSKEHDPGLFGWWQRSDDITQYILFDESSFKKELYYINEDNVLVQYAKGWYWFTEEGTLYSIKKATSMTGTITSHAQYQLLDEDQSLVIIEVDSDTAPRYVKVEHP